MKRPTPRSTLVPYTTLFRSDVRGHLQDRATQARAAGAADHETRAALAQDDRRRHHRRQPLARTRGADEIELAEHVVQVDSGADRKSTRLNSSHSQISYAACC